MPMILLPRRLALIAAVALAAPWLAPAAHAQDTAVKFQLDWRFEGPGRAVPRPRRQGLLQGRRSST